MYDVTTNFSALYHLHPESSALCIGLLVKLFFQAEDGIRDFCLSRGLGDVYKRQLFSLFSLVPLVWTNVAPKNGHFFLHFQRF